MEQTAQRNRAEWFFSEDGHRAYASSGTTGEKTRYFFEYLRGLGQKTPDRVLYGGRPVCRLAGDPARQC